MAGKKNGKGTRGTFAEILKAAGTSPKRANDKHNTGVTPEQIKRLDKVLAEITDRNSKTYVDHMEDFLPVMEELERYKAPELVPLDNLALTTMYKGLEDTLRDVCHIVCHVDPKKGLERYREHVSNPDYVLSMNARHEYVAALADLMHTSALQMAERINDKEIKDQLQKWVKKDNLLTAKFLQYFKTAIQTVQAICRSQETERESVKRRLEKTMNSAIKQGYRAGIELLESTHDFRDKEMIDFIFMYQPDKV